MSDDVDALLAKEASEHTKDSEIDRILNAFPLDAYSVLDLQPGVSPSDIKNTYRKKSLLIHPDRTKNPRAPDAFDRLKKAETALADEETRTALDSAFTDARRILIRERRWTIHDPRLTSDEFLVDWRRKTQEVLVETELRKRKRAKAQLEEEGRLKREHEREVEERRLKREQDRAWEDSRDTRVKQWRDFRKKRDAATAAAAASHSKSSRSAINARNATKKLGLEPPRAAPASGVTKGSSGKKKKIKSSLQVLG
ncbi:uncharacterized protein SAPINGB_P003753 [Magnusiomyces paraingens]|uniref:J domain-containing protein n=1 Tax=Magnusiomyces paraingens TaxID=2606893 RepID=A0A5E8BYF3_9ASCO|nr:uncharacterized protein SAPINGB_P003753 [Saprochaete ingens]VVT53795.1 unnamed protein product [Saprochaete ingens]